MQSGTGKDNVIHVLSVRVLYYKIFINVETDHIPTSASLCAAVSSRSAETCARSKGCVGVNVFVCLYVLAL